MGEYHHQLFEENGNSGRSYKLTRRDGTDFTMLDLDTAYDLLQGSGYDVVMGAVNTSHEHHNGVIKIKPELTPQGREELDARGIGSAALLSETQMH